MWKTIYVNEYACYEFQGLGLFGYALWKSVTNSDAWPNLLANIQDISSSVPS